MKYMFTSSKHLITAKAVQITCANTIYLIYSRCGFYFRFNQQWFKVPVSAEKDAGLDFLSAL